LKGSFVIQFNDTIIDKFKEKFIDKEYPKLILLSNHLKEKPRVLPIGKLNTVVFPKTVNLFFYNERTKKLYKTNRDEILELVNKLEPWDELDAVIFDESLEWVIMLNHEDLIFTLGV